MSPSMMTPRTSQLQSPSLWTTDSQMAVSPAYAPSPTSTVVSVVTWSGKKMTGNVPCQPLGSYHDIEPLVPVDCGAQKGGRAQQQHPEK